MLTSAVMRLYHAPGSRSTRALWLLEEIGAPYELTIMSREDRDSPDHLDRHPLGRVPVLEDDTGYLFESAALALQIADTHPDAGLIPAVGTHDRGLVYQWVLFGMTEIETPGGDAFRFRETDPERAGTALERYRKAVKVIENTLDGHDFLVADHFTVADLVIGSVLGGVRRLQLVDEFPNVARYLDRIEGRPARQRAYAIGT